MNAHAFGGTRDVIELEDGRLMRPIHKLVRRSEPIGKPIYPRSDSLVVGYMLWDDASESWQCFYFPGND